MEYYIIDKTLTPVKNVIINDYNDVVNYLDGMSRRAYKQTKKQRTILLEENGYGEDDRNSTLFVRSMQEQFDIGIIRDGRMVRCDLPALIAFQKPEYGN